MKRLIVLLLGLFILSCSDAIADTSKIITADDLKKLMDSGKQFALVDTRTEEEFRQGHLPKAINIAPEKVANIAALLPKARGSAVVFYCRGVG